jgi:hypothetical protein
MEWVRAVKSQRLVGIFLALRNRRDPRRYIGRLYVRAAEGDRTAAGHHRHSYFLSVSDPDRFHPGDFRSRTADRKNADKHIDRLCRSGLGAGR